MMESIQGNSKTFEASMNLFRSYCKLLVDDAYLSLMQFLYDSVASLSHKMLVNKRKHYADRLPWTSTQSLL